MNCHNCGVENPDTAGYCASCGQALGVRSMQGLSILPVGKTSGMAIASLVLAILSPLTCWLTAIPAIILGIVALVTISRSAGAQRGQGMAIAGIIVPVVMLPIMALAMGILMPALARGRTIAFRMVCGTNLSGLGKAMLIYRNDYDDRFPDPNQWCDLLVDYAEVSPASFVCKGGGPGRCHYAINTHAVELGDDAPPDMVLLFETYPGWNQSGGPDILTTEHHQNDGCNILFVDSHVEFVDGPRLRDLKW